MLPKAASVSGYIEQNGAQLKQGSATCNRENSWIGVRIKTALTFLGWKYCRANHRQFKGEAKHSKLTAKRLHKTSSAASQTAAYKQLLSKYIYIYIYICFISIFNIHIYVITQSAIWMIWSRFLHSYQNRLCRYGSLGTCLHIYQTIV
jgi:hypothetical protein